MTPTLANIAFRLPLRSLAVAALLAASAAPVTVAQVPGTSDVIHDRMMVRLLDTADPGQALADFVAAFEGDPAHPGVTLTLRATVPGRPIHLFDLEAPAGTELSEFELPGSYPTFLRWGELLSEFDAPEGTTGSTYVDGIGFDASTYDQQYAVTHLGIDVAQASSRGTGTVVAVLDTGVDATHARLAGSVLASGWNLVDGTADTRDVGDGLDTDGDGLTDEMTGHGTYVAGLVRLVAPGAKILPVRVLDGDGTGDGWTITAGLYHAIDHGVEVINLSLRTTGESQAVDEALDAAIANGIVVVAAAGNLDRRTPREYPAMEDKALGVAAVDGGDLKAGFSNYHPMLFISAPGTTCDGGAGGDPACAIVSLVPGDGFAAWDGTSMATPLVAGAAALIRAQHPEWVAGPDTYDAIRQVLASTAVDLDALNPDHAGLLGAGRLDIAAAIAEGPAEPRPGDLDNDGTVGFADLAQLLSDWGAVHTSADLDGQSGVGFADLTMLLAAWG